MLIFLKSQFNRKPFVSLPFTCSSGPQAVGSANDSASCERYLCLILVQFTPQHLHT